VVVEGDGAEGANGGLLDGVGGGVAGDVDERLDGADVDEVALEERVARVEQRVLGRGGDADADGDEEENDGGVAQNERAAWWAGGYLTTYRARDDEVMLTARTSATISGRDGAAFERRREDLLNGEQLHEALPAPTRPCRRRSTTRAP
jgi:hypothetical protein